MSITFGSVGDIISVSLLVKDLILALCSSRGSSARYQAAVRELIVLDKVLLQVDQLCKTRPNPTSTEELYRTIKEIVERCRRSVQEFSCRLKKYKSSLSTTGSGNAFKDAARKIQWKMAQTDEEQAKFRAEVTGYTDSIGMLLATVNMYF
jgi:hypothetical protein